jgi:hypothetical protein
MGMRGSFPGGKVGGRWTDHSPPSSAEVRECLELYLHSPNTPSWRGAQLKQRDSFNFTLPHSWATRLELDSRQGQRREIFFLFATASRPNLRPTEPPIKSSSGLKRPGCEADNSPSSGAEVKNESHYAPPPPPINLHGVVLFPTSLRLFYSSFSTSFNSKMA